MVADTQLESFMICKLFPQTCSGLGGEEKGSTVQRSCNFHDIIILPGISQLPALMFLFNVAPRSAIFKGIYMTYGTTHNSNVAE